MRSLTTRLEALPARGRINDIKDFLRRRAANIQNQVSQQLSVNANGDDGGQYTRLTSPNLILSGNAPTAYTQSVTVNGIEVDSLAANQDWSMSASSVSVATVRLFDLGATWRYLDDGSDQGTAWRSSGFDDAGWASGPAELGYGDGDEATVIEDGPNDNRYPTSYFRRTFEIENLAEVTSLQMRTKYDDGIAVFVNGTEVARENLADDAEFDTYADGSRRPENAFSDFTISTSALVSGTNTIAVEVHQHEPDSSDVSFDMELTAVATVDNGGAETAVRMFPGLNRYTVKAFDAKAATGDTIATEVIDVWYDTPSQVITGSIAADTTWTAEAGPYEIDGNVRIPDGVTLTIAPGTSIFFRNNARFTINGRLNAVGVPNAEIRFTRVPNTNASWNGLQFRSSMNGSRIDHAIIEYGVTGDGMIGLENSELTLNHVTLDHTDRRRIRSINSSLVVRDSVFENIFDPGQAPTTDNQSEHIWGRGIPDGGRWILERNVFGHITGHNDSVDFDAPRLPGPIPLIRENFFKGGGDDALDMTGDVWIEGNTFQNFIKDQFNVDPGESNTISSSEGTFWVIGNTFENVEHASLVKENAFSHFINNTVVSSSFAPLYFDLPGQTDGPGRGAFVQNSIFDDVPVTFDQIQPDTDLTVEYSFLPTVDNGFPGIGNQFGDPHISESGNKLLAGSNALRAGADGQDLGSTVPLGATISGEPTGTTSSSSASLKVGGPAITHYRYRLNNGAFGEERPIGQPITLTNLADGEYVVEVIGKNVLGIWQTESQANASSIWTVDRNAPASVRINEILATQDTIPLNGEYPDLIELHNPAATSIDISGFSLSDDATNDSKFVFPVGTTLSAGEYLTIVAGDTIDSILQTGFALSAGGDELYLYDNSETRQLVDSLTFGMQIDNQSIGRIGPLADWQLTRPTFGAANDSVPVNDATEVVINEWYANGKIRVRQDFIELHNPTNFPAAIGGHYLSDKPFAIPDKSPITPLSFIDANGYMAFTADGDVEDGADHVSFRLSPDLEQIALFDPDLNQIDFVFSYPQTSEVSQGRVPDAAAGFEFLTVPSPGASNGSSEAETIEFGFSWGEEWKYNRSGEDLGVAWRAANYADDDWESGAGPLGNERERLAIPIATEFELSNTTYYFRRRFDISDDINLSQVTASIQTQVDDGFVVYLNGVEVVRQGMPAGDITFDTFAERNVNEAQIEGPFSLPQNLLHNGENVFAVEVHQVSDASRDLVFGLAFDASMPVENRSNVDDLINGLRISELMFDNVADGPLDYVEVTNIANVPLELAGVRLSSVDFVFPSVTLMPGEFAVVAENAEMFIRHYGQNLQVIGQFSGELSDSGEELALQLPAPNDSAILRFDYDSNWYPAAAGQGRSLEVIDTSVSYKTWDQAATWKASGRADGTPGYATDSPVAASVVINEVLSHTDLPQVDTIELLNTSNLPIDVSGWYLSDDASLPHKFRIPSGTIIPAGGYLLFDENDFNPSLGVDPSDFALSSSEGETLWLWEATDGRLVQTIDSATFGASANGETIGRIPNGLGPLYPLVSNSLGTVNGTPRIGPVIISELNYHPADPSAAALAIDPNLDDDDLEFVEIHNSSSSLVNLTDWRIRKGIDFDFADDTLLPAGGTMLIVPFDPSTSPTKLAAFREHYGLNAATRIVGGFRGKLDNGDDVVQLQRPDSPPAEKPSFIPRLLEDELRYDDSLPWPASADGIGDSLHRTSLVGLGRDANSWSADSPTPGFVNGATVLGDLTGEGVVDAADIDVLCSAIRANNRPEGFDLNGDLLVDVDDMFYLVETVLGSGVGDANLDGIFNSTDFVVIFRAGEYEDAFPGNSTWAEGDWNCDGDFSSQDLVTAFQRGNYSRAAIPNRPPTEVVPATASPNQATLLHDEFPMLGLNQADLAQSRTDLSDRAAAVESIFADYEDERKAAHVI